MNILFEIADRDLMIIGAIFLLILIIAFIVFKRYNEMNKVEPIPEDERFDSEIEVKEISNDELTDEQKKAKEELQKLYNQMSMDLEESEPTKEEIDEFEREQEENAIISYQELMAEAERLKAKTDTYEKKAEEKAGTYVDEAINTYRKKEAYQGFKNSEIISPIYGIQSEKKSEKVSTNYKTNDIINRAYEEKEDMEFLNSLKEFRKNL